MSKIKVCCYLEHWASGGIECFITNTLATLPSSSFEVDIVADLVEDSIYTETVERAGARVIEMSGKLRAGENERIFKHLVEDNRYDIVHLHIFHGLALKYAKIAKDCGVPVRIAHCHGAGLRNSPTKFLKLLLHYYGLSRYKNDITHALACSEAAAKFMHLQNATIVKNGIEVENYAFNSEARENLREELELGERPVIGHIGRLSNEKNHTFLLDSFAQIKKRQSDAVLLIVGEGDMQEQIEKKVVELGLGDSVKMLGARRDIPALLSAMDLFLFPSLVEGFGIVALEAQASGLPIITSVAVPEMARISDNAFALETKSAEEWAELSLSLLEKKLCREKGVTEVKDSGFDRATTSRAILNIYTASYENRGGN